MRRGAPFGLCVLAACAAAGPWARVDAAEITRVASAGQGDKPFELDLTVRWDHTLRRGKVTREVAGSAGATTVDQLQYKQITNAVVSRVAVGLYHDLELHAEMPYTFSDERSVDGRIDAAADVNDVSCTNCPILAAPAAFYRSGLGNLKLGLVWGILSDKRDDTKPFWLVGIDVTLPTAARYDPYTSPGHRDSSNPAPVGEKIWVYDLYTALSKRMGQLDPYVRAHVRLPASSGGTYSNCDHASDTGLFNQSAAANCADAIWKDEAGAKPPTIIGLLVGAEIVPYESAQQTERLAFDVRIGAEYVSAARWFNELTDATRKLLQTERYLTLSGRVALNLRASSYFQLQASASFEHEFTHYLTGENLGVGGGYDPSVVGTPQQNPNFDFRYDPPGRRFRIENTTVLTLAVAAVVNL